MQKENPEYQYLLVDPPPEKTRPWAVTVVCVLGFIYTLGGIIIITFFPHSVAELVRIYGKHLPILSVIINLFSLVAFVGIWRMRYWGIFLYTAAFIAEAVHSQIIDYEIWWSYVPGLIIILTSVVYINRNR